MTDSLIDRFFYAGSGMWNLFAEIRERAPTLPAHPTVVLGFVAIARAAEFTPPERLWATAALQFFDDAVRKQVTGALRDQGLIGWFDNGSLYVTEKGKLIAATLRGDEKKGGDWIDLPPQETPPPPAPVKAETTPSVEVEIERDEEEEIPPPPGVPEEELDETEATSAPAVPSFAATGDQFDSLPPDVSRSKVRYANVTAPVAAAPAAPPSPPRRKSLVNREPPGVPRY